MEPVLSDLNFYLKRTVEHIHRVQKNAVILCTQFADDLSLSREEIRLFMHNVMIHDRSKFSNEQFEAYIQLTKYYNERRNGNPNYQYPYGVEDKVNAAITHHYNNENHHPEIANGGTLKWGKLNVLEAACDLQAMAQEFSEGTCRKYYEEVWKKKQSKNFYDDYNWIEITIYMNKAIECFESFNKQHIKRRW